MVTKIVVWMAGGVLWVVVSFWFYWMAGPTYDPVEVATTIALIISALYGINRGCIWFEKYLARSKPKFLTLSYYRLMLWPTPEQRVWLTRVEAEMVELEQDLYDAIQWHNKSDPREIERRMKCEPRKGKGIVTIWFRDKERWSMIRDVYKLDDLLQIFAKERPSLNFVLCDRDPDRKGWTMVQYVFKPQVSEAEYV